jgi:integrase
MAGLTEKAIGAARASDGERFLWDGHLPGFGCRIKPASAKNPDGVKTFLLQYRVGMGTRRVKLGRSPAMRVEEARTKARALLAAIDKGADPSAERKRNRAVRSDSLEAVAADFIEKHAKAKGRRGWRETQRIFAKYVSPGLGKRHMRDVTRRDVIDLLDKVATKHGPIMANRVLAAVRKLFNWSIARDIIDASPLAGIERPGEETARDRVLSEGEICEVWAAADAVGYPYGHMTKALLLAGQRRGEVSRMREAEVDTADTVWTLPPERTKNKLPHEVPLFPALSTLIADALAARAPLPEDVPAAGDFVFTTAPTHNKPVNSHTRAKELLDAAITAARRKTAEQQGRVPAKVEAMPAWTFHDLRRTMRTRLSKLGVAPEIAERILNHVPTGVRQVYDRHQFREEKRAALELWAKALAAILSPSDNVVVLTRKGTAS